MKAALAIVPYRHVHYFEAHGPSVRDWAFIEVAERAAQRASVDVHLVDRPHARLPARNEQKYNFASTFPGVILHSVRTPKLVQAAIFGRSYTAGFVAKTLTSISRKYDRMLVLDFDPFARFDPPVNALHWFDEIDDFSRHMRIAARDRRSFDLKRQGRFWQHTAADARNTNAVHIANWAFSASTPAALPLQGAHFLFGFIGYVDQKIDVGFVRQLASLGNVAFFGKVLDASTGHALDKIDRVHVAGAFHPTDLDQIMTQFDIGIIPFQPSRIHGNSPIKFFQYTNYGKFCVSTDSFGIQQTNLIVVDKVEPDLVDRCRDLAERTDWEEMRSLCAAGRTELDSLLQSAIYELTR